MANQANVITFEDDQAFRQLSYSWATSYDTKVGAIRDL